MNNHSLTHNPNNMKKIYLVLFCITILFVLFDVSVFAQQVPNPNFEEWNGEKFDGQIQPSNWYVSNISQAGFNFNLAHQEAGHTGSYSLMVKDTEVGALGITELSPGYFSLGKPWSHLEGLNTGTATAGTSGGINWAHRPDTMSVWIKRTGNNTDKEDFYLLYYAWSGTAKSDSYKNKNGGCTSVSQTNEESDIRQALDANECGTAQQANQIAEGMWREKKEYGEWTNIRVPIYYFNDDIPEMMNIIFSASNYPNFRAKDGLYKDNALYVDDIEFIYSSKIDKLYIQGKEWKDFDPNSTEEQVYSVSEGTEMPDVYGVRGVGSITNARGHRATFSGRKLTSEEFQIVQQGTINGDPMIIQVNATDGSSTTTYKIKFVSASSTPNTPSYDLEWSVEISNLITSEMVGKDKASLQLMGSDNYGGLEVMLFIPDYTGEDKEYALDLGNYYLTLVDTELTLVEGTLTKSTDEEKGDIFAGRIVATVKEDGTTAALDLTMYSTPPVEIELEDVTITIDEGSAIALFTADWEYNMRYDISIELEGFEEVPFKEYPYCSFYMEDAFGGIDRATGLATVIIEDDVVTLEGVFAINSYNQYQWGPGQSYHVTLSGNIPIKEDPVGEESVTACDSYDWNGQTYTQSGDYTYTTVAANGSDSIATLHLTINKTQYDKESVVACDNYDWNGQIYTQSGDYTYNTIATNGCDSIVTLHLTINQSEVGATEYATICHGETYTWNGQDYATAGSYTANLYSVLGCDSTAILHLTVLPEVIRKTEYISAPTNKTVNWRGKEYNETGTYYDTVHFVVNPLCDSVIYMLDLTIADNIDSDKYCGDNLTWYYSNGALIITGSGAMYDDPDRLTYRDESWYPARVNHISLPDAITHIGNVAFSDCANLTSIVIPSSVTSIGDGAFSWTGLQAITIPTSVTDLGEQVFEACNGLHTFLYESEPRSISNQTIHPLIGCVHLDTIIAPAALWHCTTADPALEARYGVPHKARYIEVTDGFLTDQAIKYIANNSGAMEVLDLTNATNTTLPYGAWSNNYQLSTLYLPQQIEVIPESMVEGARNLSEIAIPATVTEIGNYAFAGCVNVWRMTVDAVIPPKVYESTFDGISRSISVQVPAGSEELYREAAYWREFFIEHTNNPSPISNCQKLLRKDQILILRNGKVYTTMGQLVTVEE